MLVLSSFCPSGISTAYVITCPTTNSSWAPGARWHLQTLGGQRWGKRSDWTLPSDKGHHMQNAVTSWYTLRTTTTTRAFSRVKKSDLVWRGSCVQGIILQTRPGCIHITLSFSLQRKSEAAGVLVSNPTVGWSACLGEGLWPPWPPFPYRLIRRNGPWGRV